MQHLQGAASGVSRDASKTRGAVATSNRFPQTLSFEVKPQEICFVNFEPHKTYELPLTLKNRTKEAQFVQVARPRGRLLELQLPRGKGTTTKVAPGLSVTYKVRFTPEDFSDYSDDLVVTTRDEEFTIPVHAIASRGELTLPELFAVTPCPVKGRTETALFLRNAGKMECQWRAEAFAPFSIAPSSGVVPPNGGISLATVTFAPPDVHHYHSTIVFHLGPEEDVTQELPVVGDAVEVNVVLEQSTLEFPGTFVTMENQAVVCVRNNSEHTVEFSWKSERSDVEEQRAMEYYLSRQPEMTTNPGFSNSLHRATQKRLAEDRFEVFLSRGRVFDDDVFTIEPVSGKIYAKGKREFVITFNPQLAMEYLATAYLEIGGRRHRLPLQVKGSGIGPQCELGFSHLDIGNIFLGALYEYKVAIMNKSCIEARYAVLPQDTLMGKKFTFCPVEGVLAPGEEETLNIQLQSDLVGLISETFRIHLHGSLDDLTLRFRGRVIGPSLEFDVEELDFGNVSYNCLHSRPVRMKNIGKIPIRFSLRIPESAPLHAAITVSPSEGLIPPEMQQEIRVNFASNHVGCCETRLLLDVDGIGDGVDSLPIKATCLVPALQLSTEQLHYGTCFVGHEYTMNLEVVNKTALLGKYNVVLVNEESISPESALVVIDSAETKDAFKTIEPRSRSLVPVKLTPLVVGSLRMTLYVRVLGSSEPPLPVLLTATVRGPAVTVEPKSLAFGTLPLLEHAEQSFVLNNTSPIPAVFSAGIVSNGGRATCSVFCIDQLEGEIPPYSSTTVKVTACLDDARHFSEKIQITVRHAEGDEHLIPVTAHGTGYALVPTTLIDKIDFGDVFTATTVEKVIVLENKGQRDVDVMWGSSRGTRTKVGGPPIVFRICPETCAIPSGKSCTFTIQALASEACNLTEEFFLKEKREFKQILSISITGNFITPLIAYSTKRVVFDYTYGAQSVEGCALMVKTFTMKNKTTQPLRVMLKHVETPGGRPSPFALVEPTIFTLASGETHIVGVNCDASYRQDNIAHTAKGRVLVSFLNHPFSEYLSLVANLAFPTISIEPEGKQINFGSILADTEGRSQLTLTNLSPSVEAEFLWCIKSREREREREREGDGDSLKKSETAQKRFDVVPFRGTIPPAGKRVVEAIFYGTRGRHEAIATCTLKGGPSYEVNLIGWSDVTVHFDCTHLDFGIMHYNTTARKKIAISSPLRVAVPFTVNVSSLKHPGCITVKPMKGVVTDKVMLTVTFSPLIPEEILETFFVQVGHLDPQPITVRGLGQTYSVMVTTSDNHVTLTRVEDPVYLRCLENLKDGEWVPYHTKSGFSDKLPDVDLAVLEAERLAYCQKILATADPLLPRSSFAMPAATEFFAGEKTKGKEASVISRYVVDFGHMMWQETRTIKLQLTNTSIYPTTLHVPKWGTDVETLCVAPRKISTISPFAKTEITLSLSSNNSDYLVRGANQFEFFLDINKGPRIVVMVHCLVATPLMTPCESSLDFGDLFLGRIKTMQLHFYNNEAVACAWTLKLIASKQKHAVNTDADEADAVPDAQTNSSKQQFRVNKERGTLPPHSGMTLQVSFMSHCLGLAKAKLRFRYASNPEDHFVPIKGNVVRANVELSPSPLEFLPTLPYQTMRHSFTITNNEEYAVEVYNLNNDPKHRVQMDVLRRAMAMKKAQLVGGSEIYLPVREAGGSLPESLLDAVFEDLQPEELSLEYCYPGGIEEDRFTERRSASRASSRRRQSMNQSMVLQTTWSQQRDVSIPTEALQSQALPTSKPQLVIITGPPFSGRTTQTQLVLETLDLVQVDLDAMVRSEAEFDTAEGECIRTILSEREENLVSCARDDAANDSPLSSMRKFFDSKVVKILYTLLTRHLSTVGSFVDVVVDDIKSILTNDREEILFAIEKAASFLGRTLQIVSIGVSEATTGLRRNLETQQKCREALDAAITVPLTEAEYEQLNEEERDAYNHRLLHYNTCKRILAKATNEVSRYTEELKNPQLTVQALVDAEIAREEGEALLRSSTKGKKVAPEPRPKTQWGQLSELDQYKELYARLCRSKNILHVVVDGNESKEKVKSAIINNAFTCLNGANAKPATPQIVEVPKKKREAFITPCVLFPGIWELITEDFLGRTQTPLEEFRLFSVVQREIVPKKAQKGVPPQMASAFEEVSRWVVPPKSSVEVTVVFCTEKLGKRNTPFVFGITGTSQEMTLPVLTCTEYPEICRDEKSIFSVTKPRAVAGRQLNRVFIMSKRTYDFGPLIIPGALSSPSIQPLKRSKSSNSFDVSAGRNSMGLKEVGACDTMTFRNVGIFPADVLVTVGREKDTTFSVVPSKFTLPVGEKMTVVLRAAPEVIGEVSSKLVVTVRDNPIPWSVNVSCIGTRPAVTLDGKKEFSVQYGRCLITRQVGKVITIANVSLMPTRWNITGIDKLPGEFELSSTSGLLDVNAVYPLSIVFKPTRPDIHNVSLKVEVTDANEETLFESLPVTIKAEAHDAVVEWSRSVDFKLMHVGDTRKEMVRILNKSPYDVGYKLRLPKALQNLITLSPSEGVLRGLVGFKDAALANVEVSLRFDREGEIPTPVGMIEASFFDPIANELLYPVQNIPVTGEAWYNKFTIRPSCIDFGSCIADQKKQSGFELRNTGRFPLHFRLFNYRDGPAMLHREDEEGTGRKSRKSARMEQVFQLGAFSVTPSSGSVAVGECLVFQVSTVQTATTRNKETLGIYVDHCDREHEAKGVPFELVASPTTPGIVADLTSQVDVDTIFEEQQVVTNLSEHNKSLRAYAKEGRVFSFGTVLLGSRVDERFRIANSSPLTCSVKLQLLPKLLHDVKEKEKDRKEKEKEKDVGSLSLDGFQLLLEGESENRNIISLLPFESCFVTIGFSPPMLLTFNVLFEASVIGGTNSKTSTLRFELLGRGVLPKLEYILPPRLQMPFTITMPTQVRKGAKGKGKESKKVLTTHVTLENAANSAVTNTIQFPFTLVGSMSLKEFTVRNTGNVDAHIRLTAPDDCPNDIHLSKLREELFLPSGASETFSLTFVPSVVAKHRVRLRVSVIENPYEDKELWVVAESYFHAISFDNIDPWSEEHLTLGYWYVSQPKEHVVTIRNNSPHAIRFEWDCSFQALQCSPTVGHMTAGSSKQVTFRLFTETTLRETVQCTLRVTSIETTEGDEWDDTQTKSKWVLPSSPEEAEGVVTSISSEADARRNLRRVQDAVPEPYYTITNDLSVQKTLYVSYSCEPTSYKITLPMNGHVDVYDPLVFPLTKILQKRSTTLRITNTGHNVLPFSFLVKNCQQQANNDTENCGVFTVEPASGDVQPLTHRDVSVTFAPKSIEHAAQLLLGTFPHSEHPNLSLLLQGTAECPLVHFNVPQCDYLTTRIDGEAGPDLHPDTIPIIFRACGLQTKCTVSFKVINPSATTYRFEWMSDPLSQQISPFRCLTPSGSITAGKQYEMTFDYVATSIGTRESKWTFFISDHISVPFLLVGKGKEPNVSLSLSKVNFGGITVGNKDERLVKLENHEDASFSFSFDRSLLEGENSCIAVKPISGVVPPKSSLPVTVVFFPKDEISVNVRLTCRVKRLVDPLTLNVKGEGLRVHSLLTIEEEDIDSITEPITVPLSQRFHFNLGRVQVDTVVKKRLVLLNEGQCAMDYVLAVPEHRFINITPQSGTVGPKQRAVMVLSYSPKEEETLRSFKFHCRVDKSSVYTICLKAVSYLPKIQFSFTKHDFGPCFTAEFASDTVVSTTLNMINGEAKESVSLDCALSNDDIFDLSATSFLLQPGEMQSVKISFSPREVGNFMSDLRVLINGSYSVYIPLVGEGIVPRIEVPIRFLKLGAARIGERRSAELRLDCRSLAITPVSLANTVDASLREKGVSFSPNDLFLMRPREVRTITVSFKPTIRMPEFQREVRMLVCGREVPLAIVSGSCEDAEVHLDVQNILFDDVVVGASACRRIVIMNSGDISQRFKWDLLLLGGGEMKINPASGFIRAHAEHTCEIVYTPKKAKTSFRRPITVEFDSAPPLSVNVEAHSIERPKAVTVMSFNCKAKSSETKTLSVENPTDMLWTVKPTIDNRLWTSPRTLTVNPKSSAKLSVTYSPLFVSRDKEVGTLFIPLPTGSALTVQLEGVTTSPIGPEVVQEKQVEANLPHKETFEVQNGTSHPLRFHVTVNWTPEPESGTVTVKAPVTIDVPAKQTKECSIIICPMNEGSLRGTVEFRCAEREDYTQVFNVALRVLQRTLSSRSELVATVRTSAIHRLAITNPLAKNVTVNTKVENGSDCIFVDPSIVIPRKSTVDLPIRFFPLLHKEYPTATVTATSPELGVTSCRLNLSSNPPLPEKASHVSCPLGQSIVFPLCFTHYSKANCEFTVRMTSKTTSFTKCGNPGSVKVPGTTRPEGCRVTVDLQYEPTCVGETKEVIEVISPQAGTYIFPFLASCSPPEPQGPFIVRTGQPALVPFKNVFNESITFTIATDSSHFVVSKATENVAAKKTINISVSYKSEENPQATHTAKLIVSGVCRGETLQWVYYLKHVVQEDTTQTTTPVKKK